MPSLFLALLLTKTRSFSPSRCLSQRGSSQRPDTLARRFAGKTAASATVHSREHLLKVGSFCLPSGRYGQKRSLIFSSSGG